MKRIKILNYIALLAMFLIIGCEGDTLIDKAEGELFEVKGATLNMVGAEQVFDKSDAEMTPVTFMITTNGEAVSAADLYMSLNGGDPQLVKTINSFPSNESYTITDAASAVGVGVADLVIGDVFTATIRNVVASSGTYSSGASFNIAVIESEIPFKSALEGVFTCRTVVNNLGAGIPWDDCDGAVWEGVVEWVALHTDPDADGSYQVLTTAPSGEVLDDISHGAYYGCYGTDAQGNLPNGDLFLSDVDGRISIPGASQWGEVYSLTALEVNGALLTFTWVNDYGEAASVELTRNDGEDWPALSF